ncbi:MAG: BlaI/MecI/CopY family transcriptional regulator [Planctomycetota bacterium]|jgi:predicted transcriptional regulator|nr:BlaI/MecI/CopY family transcriptional regulator [Planctomycetota bacterium]
MKALLFESEIRVMECLWANGDTPAAELVPVLEEQVGWNKNTTYTIIKKLIAKGYVERSEPRFVCHPLITREDVEKAHAEDLVERLYGGSNLLFLSAFVKNQKLSANEIGDLRALIDSLDEGGK